MNKKPNSKAKGVVKGAPSGFVISLLVHAGAFALAGLLVVFTVVKKEEKKFEPPAPVERPKMKLKKPKVKVKKNSKPQSTTRIVTKVTKADMPDIQLPELGGMGTGLEGGAGLGGFEMMPNLDDVTLFGGGQTIGNDFVGTFYDFKRYRTGGGRGISTDEFKALVGTFVRSGFKTSKLSRFYQSPKKLYATSFMIPTVLSSTAPKAFGEGDADGWCWMAHYKGQLVHPEAIKFRFWGQGDDILIVRVDGEIVLNASWPNTEIEYCKWVATGGGDRQYRLGNNLMVPGDWIELKANEPLDMEVVIGEVPGGHYDAMLLVEEEGVDYPDNHQAGPIFPMFKTTVPSHDLRDAIYEWLIPGEACVTSGPVFCDFNTSLSFQEEEEEPEEVVEEEKSMRIWNLGADKALEADYVSVMGDKLVLKKADGNTIKVPMESVSDEDREYIELSNPPKFTLGFVKGSDQRFIETTPFLNEDMPAILEWKFGAKIKQNSSVNYNHELNMEYFAVGQQSLDGNKYILLDRADKSFTLNKENQRAMQFKGDRLVETMNYTMKDQDRGETYRGFLILLRDKRGEIIQYRSSPDWLYDIHKDLEKIPTGRYFDKTGKRVHPAGPKVWY